MIRKYTYLLSELVDEGLVDPEAVVRMCLAYMSEDDVKDMCRANDILIEQLDAENE
jgi:hypothetical protein